MTISSRFVLAIVLAVGTTAYAADHPVVGKWKLNKQKSQFQSSTTEVSQSMLLDCNAELCKVDEVRHDGQRLQWSHSAGFGKDLVISGLKNAKISTRKISDRSLEHTWNLDGAMSKGTAVVSPDGKTMTYTYTGKSGDGKPFKDVMIFDRQ